MILRHYKNKMLIGILLIISLSSIVLGILIYQLNQNDNIQVITPSTINKIAEALPQVTPTIQDLPFKELTIPYLRNKEYKSNLAELNLISENTSYTTYLTSYDSDGLKINGLLTVPKGEVPQGGFSAIVFVHGYIPPSQYVTTQNYADYVSYLARNGFVVFKIDLRGHGSSQGEPGGGYYSGDYVIDTLNARAALQNADFVNKENIGLWGHSMAGNVVMRAFTAKPEIKAIVIWAGAVYTYKDMQEYGIQDSSYRPPSEESPSRQQRNALRETHGNFDPNSEFWKQVAPTNYLNDIQGAVQLNHAVNDNVVSIEYSRNLQKLMSEAGKEVELHEYSNGGHNINGSAFTQAMQNTVRFYTTHLQ